MYKTTPAKAKLAYKKKMEAAKCEPKKYQNTATEEHGETVANKRSKEDDSKQLLQRIFTFGNFQPHRQYMLKVLPQYSFPLQFSIQNLSFHESTVSSILETNTFDLILHEMSKVEGVTRPLLIICLQMNHFCDKRSSIEIVASIVSLHERAHTLGIQTIALEIPENKKTGPIGEEEVQRMDANNRLKVWAQNKQAQSNMICFVPFRCDTASDAQRCTSTRGILTRQAEYHCG